MWRCPSDTPESSDVDSDALSHYMLAFDSLEEKYACYSYHTYGTLCVQKLASKYDVHQLGYDFYGTRNKYENAENTKIVKT